jgi:signal transduction histidine kinase
VTQAVIRAHGGEITLEPPSDGGSTFLVRLPLQGAAAESMPATAAV